MLGDAASWGLGVQSFMKTMPGATKHRLWTCLVMSHFGRDLCRTRQRICKGLSVAQPLLISTHWNCPHSLPPEHLSLHLQSCCPPPARALPRRRSVSAYEAQCLECTVDTKILTWTPAQTDEGGSRVWLGGCKARLVFRSQIWEFPKIGDPNIVP